jgi:SAM-dependent methyltransferase
MFVRDVPPPEELASIYAAENYYELPQESIRRIEEENRRRVRVIQDFTPTGAFLDIGCARGTLLDEACIAGFETHGIELSKINAEISSNKGHKVFTGSLMNYSNAISGQRFDVIACLDVIEHVETPFEFLQTAVSLLSSEGLLVLSTPNYSGLIAKLLGRRDPYMTPPEHLNFFTARGLRVLCSRCTLDELAYCNFGRLTPAETERALRRYVPRPFGFADALLRPASKLFFRLANQFRLGLEQEIYLMRRH